MAFIGNLFKSFMGSEGPSGNTVTEVGISQFTRIPIQYREDCLVLYGPTHNNTYELLMHQSVHNSLSKAYSLFRTVDNSEAQIRFIALKEVLPPLAEHMPHEIANQQVLQTICDLVRDHPTWTAAHIAAHLGYSHLFLQPSVLRFADTADMEMKETPLHLAIKQGHLDIIRTLMKKNVSVDVTDVKGNSVYHLAATSNETIIKLVTQKESRLLNIPNEAGKTPLHLACEGDKPDCVKALLCAGADVNVAATHDSTLPIHSAMAANSTLCAREIIAMYPNQLNVKDMKDGGTPLHWATSREIINAMVDLGCNINARNFHGLTALHKMVQNNRLACVLTLLSCGAEVNVCDDAGDLALHMASSAAVLQALLVFGGNATLPNNKGLLVRHVVASSSYKEKNIMLYILHAVGAPRCQQLFSDCTEGCTPTGSFDGVPNEFNQFSRSRINYDEFLDAAMFEKTINGMQGEVTLGFSGLVNSTKEGGRILCLDGGGIKGLVLIQLLIALEEAAGRPVLQLFDWIVGTSTGGILALALAMGKSVRYTQGLYFRMKDLVFVGRRPYDEKPLEDILRKEFGETTVMSEINGPKVIVTGVLADRSPADLHLFRNYVSGEKLLEAQEGAAFTPTKPPHQQLVWHAARASGAAPSYFRAYGRFIDGGLISNNPTLDILTEIAEYNVVLNALGRSEEAARPSVLVSLGTGRPPVSKVDAIDCFRPESMWSTVQMAFGLSNIAKMLIDQATMADNCTVDRARAWCASCGITYLRLSPQLSLDVQLDDTRDDILVNALWETMVYIRSKNAQIHKFATLLTAGRVQQTH
ncbi:85/88 kDa calcium-independent phospholipase A2 [Procambarus clarkii]|uniref:85/88 kDa calcium-independent phospholipase A2 n=1 Tax=Procambarus clarkii TaxID=6728 RepID=UPI001E671853|nr:85/88 kDa calcium-independent phospholipase A2-like [Procambarus clarkii]XP_045582088.1 85/88 kDa calcium-independent phospholipase A2-like [Procambarus clarkii]